MRSLILKMWSYIFGRREFEKFNLTLFHLSLRGLGFFNYYNHSLSGEIFVINKVIAKVDAPLNIFDVGANQGRWSSLLQKKPLEIRKLYMFEPNKVAFDNLKSASRTFEVKSEAYNLALSNTKGKGTLYEDKSGSTHGSLSKNIFSDIYKTESSPVDVELTTLDSFCQTNCVDVIHFLKLDVEGHELNLLKGGRKLINENRILMIQFEFTQLNSTLEVHFKQFYDLLSPKYSMFRMLPNGLLPYGLYDPTKHEIFGFHNVLCISKESKIIREII